MYKKRPTFIGIGAQKAGTTWLHKHFRKHSEVWMPPVKELHFFDRALHYPTQNKLATPSPFARMLGSEPWQRKKMISHAKALKKSIKQGRYRDAFWYVRWTFGYYDENWYTKLFNQASSNQICGEISPSYSVVGKEDVARMKSINSDMKIIFLIRNPIERAWSAIRFNVDRGFSKNILDSDEEIIAALKKPRMILRGDYERTLDAYMNHFDSSQILVCFYDAIRHDPLGLLSDITQFLNISPFDKSAINMGRINASASRQMSPAVSEFLLEMYAPMINRIAKSLGSYVTNWNDVENNFDENQQENSLTRFSPTVHP